MKKQAIVIRQNEAVTGYNGFVRERDEAARVINIFVTAANGIVRVLYLFVLLGDELVWEPDDSVCAPDTIVRGAGKTLIVLTKTIKCTNNFKTKENENEIKKNPDNR